jgi:hypothetical protein
MLKRLAPAVRRQCGVRPLPVPSRPFPAPGYLDVHWVGGLGVSHLATGRMEAGAASAVRSKSTNGGSPPARGEAGVPPMLPRPM